MGRPRLPRTAAVRALVLGVALAALSACSGGGVHPVGTYTPPPGSTTGGDAVAPFIGARGGKIYLFRTDKPKVTLQPESVTLANLAAKTRGIVSTGLPSTTGATAVMVAEDSPGTPWGAILSRVEPALFRGFVADRTAGDWLILVTDVVVHGERDPVPPTAYRWTRTAVARYVSCGIPASGTNACKATFFQAAQSKVLAPPAGPGRGA